MSDKNIRKILPDSLLSAMERLSSRLAPGGNLGPIEDRFEYEKGLENLPPEERQLVEELTRFADFCKYFSERNEKLGPEIMSQVSAFPRLSLPEKIEAVRKINEKLMERVNDANSGTQFRN